MSQTTISTFSLNSGLVQTIQSTSAKLSETQTEISTGRFADTGLVLGALTGTSVSLREQQNSLKTIATSNSFVSTRLDTTQSILKSVASDAQSFLESLVGTTSAGGDASTIQTLAQSNLKSLISNLNSTLDGNYLFGGINSGQQPITDYQNGSPNSNALDQAFQTAFGMSQTDSNVSSITSAAMTNFLTTSFSDQFQGSNWSTNWSSASDQTMTTKISDSQTANTSVSANQPAFKELISAYTMIGELGTANLNSDTYNTLVGQAITTIKGAISDLTDVQGGVGLVQNQVTSANDSMSLRMDYLSSQVDSLESVDPAEASTRMTALQTQLETAYSLTAQLHNMSLVNYL
ncbi:flagellar hook-associated family protein [Beijerinckia mobilis]|uniref:flagellar hook-associated family protein n=1 Tax=Beijerinckia mobilis TaxID=231434 RepID=UPI00055070B5|nr:flagellar hook-associated family protein [Beijerinckia mobilis]